MKICDSAVLFSTMNGGGMMHSALPMLTSYQHDCIQEYDSAGSS